jgi:hypothetical protein
MGNGRYSMSLDNALSLPFILSYRDKFMCTEHASECCFVDEISYDRTKVWATEWDGMSDERRPVYFSWEIPGDKILNIYSLWSGGVDWLLHLEDPALPLLGIILQTSHLPSNFPKTERRVVQCGPAQVGSASRLLHCERSSIPEVMDDDMPLQLQLIAGKLRRTASEIGQ